MLRGEFASMDTQAPLDPCERGPRSLVALRGVGNGGALLPPPRRSIETFADDVAAVLESVDRALDSIPWSVLTACSACETAAGAFPVGRRIVTSPA